MQPAGELLEALVHLLQDGLEQLAQALELLLHPHHALAQLDLSDGRRLAGTTAGLCPQRLPPRGIRLAPPDPPERADGTAPRRHAALNRARAGTAPSLLAARARAAEGRRLPLNEAELESWIGSEGAAASGCPRNRTYGFVHSSSRKTYPPTHVKAMRLLVIWTGMACPFGAMNQPAGHAVFTASVFGSFQPAGARDGIAHDG